MAEIEFSSAEKQHIGAKLKQYFDSEMDQELGSFEAQFLLDFISKEIGGFFYNKGLEDAQAALAVQLENFSDAIYALESPTDMRR